MSSASTAKRVKAGLDKVLGGALVVLMTVAVLNVLWQVTTRFVLGDPSSFTEELARYLLIWIGVLGAGYAVGQRAHLALELLPERLEGRSLHMLRRVILGCVAAFALLIMVVGGIRLVYLQFMLGQTSPTLGWPLGVVYAVVPLSGLVMLIYTVLEIVNPSIESDAASKAHDVGSA
jgi:TRAP-type C4-dicarboxylate transport system permease small subunit